MYGAILGDMIGSPYEFDMGNKSKDFPLFSERSTFTDDTVMTIAVGWVFLDAQPGADEGWIRYRLIREMQRFGKMFPDAGYGGMFRRWLRDRDPQPYNTISETEIIKQVNQISPDNEITSLDEICLVRSYDLSQVVGKYKFVDIIAALAEGAATGAPGFVGLPFNLVLSTFLFYRAVQSIALFYGYDIKNDPAELQIASEVFMSALNPKGKGETELSGAIAKVMLLTSATTVKQTVKKGWTAMAQKGGVPLLLAQMRALANGAAKKALEKAGKKGLEKTAFTEVFEQIGKKLTQKSIGKAIPYIGAFIGATIDTAQMVQITQYAELFYCKRFILEKESRIYALTGKEIPVIDVAQNAAEQN